MWTVIFEPFLNNNKKMKTKTITIIALLISLFILISCNNSSEAFFNSNKNEKQIKKTLEKLLLSLENKNIDLLESTMSPSGKMELIVPSTEITYTVDEFVNFHKEWFKDSTWSMSTKIINIESGKYIGTATTEAIYKEPDRNGKPYFNHMIVSYVLKKENDNNWYVIKDHASSLKKSTD